MIFLRNRLADFELHVALYYMRRGALWAPSIAPSSASRITTVHRRCAAP